MGGQASWGLLSEPGAYEEKHPHGKSELEKNVHPLRQIPQNLDQFRLAVDGGEYV